MRRLPARISRRSDGEQARDAILRILKIRGEATVEDLSQGLKLTYSGVRRHLATLQHGKLITSRLEQRVRGRPEYRYRLTENAADHFPSGYEQLAGNLLATILEQQGHPGVMDYLKANNDRLAKQLSPRLDGKALADRVAEVASYYRENGYMTEWQKLPDGNFFLYHQNCAILNLAIKYRQLCVLEPRLMETLLGVKVSRQQYILKDHPICGYLIDAHRHL
jgi:predicted ArsR family transcriptional regulator